MFKNIAFIGVGHIAKYLIKGFINTGRTFNFHLADPNIGRTALLAQACNGKATENNQAAVSRSELIILCLRPADLDKAVSSLDFKEEQIVASVVAGVGLNRLSSLVHPAKPVRLLPISCAAINQSPILMFPGDKPVRELFSLIGQVHVLADESGFDPGTALVGAFYAWIFLLMDKICDWTTQQGFDPAVSRQLILETIEGACGMARFQKDRSLHQIWNTLATPGGISELGARVLNSNHSLEAWEEALETVSRKLRDSRPKIN